MAIRRTPHQKEELGGDILVNIPGLFIVVGIITAAVVLFCGAITIADHSDYNDARDARVRIVKYVNDAADPQTAAQSLLNIDSQGLRTDLRTGAQDLGGNVNMHALAAERKALAETADTGKPLKLNLSSFSFDSLWRYMELYVDFMFLASGIYLLIGYWVDGCWDSPHRYFLADLPWKRVWPIFFVVLIPASWPFMLVSAVRLLKAEELPAPVQHHRYYDDYDMGYDEYDDYGMRPLHVEVTIDQRPTQRPAFINAPTAGRQQYHHLRTVSWRREHNRRVNDLEEDERWTSENLSDLSIRIKDAQSRLNTVRSELALERTAAANRDQHELTAEKLNREFDRMMQLPGIKAVRVINDSVHLLLEARMTYKKTTYDLGDWELWFSADSDELRTRELRSGVRSSWHGSYPAYRLGGGTFCFGSRQPEITQNIRKGQYLEAVELAVACMQSVNPDDRQDIPRAFYTIDETEKMEVQQ